MAPVSHLDLADPARCLHQRFETWADRTPDRTALRFQGRQIAYADLDAQANRLAHLLVAKGVVKETLVGLCLDRSEQTLVAILAVLKARGAYVPLDPVYPEERIQLILQDAGCPVVITQRALRDKLGHIHTAQVLVLEEIAAELDAQSESNLNLPADPQDLAYVIYTSGSTGTPKGVLITHHNVMRLMDQCAPWYQFNDTDVWPLFHSYAFDMSVWEIWGAFMYGGVLVVVGYQESRSPAEFYALLVREGVTMLNQTPSAFHQIVEYEKQLPPDRYVHSLRFVTFGGEILDFPGLRPWLERHGDQHPVLVNKYGITETTVHNTYRPVRMEDCYDGAPSLIGVPIPDLQIYVLDSEMREVGVNETGEIYVGGPGLGRGYLNRAELTAERFLQNPFDPSGAGRLYKSGDLVCRLPNGELACRGRIDHQIKIRGFRVELGEIESVIGACPEVQKVSVEARNGGGDVFLIAYYSAAGTVPPQKLREHVSRKLPPYMVPGRFQQVERFPLTPNGKIDRKALAAMMADRVESGTLPTSSNPTEKALIGCWAELLPVSTFGLDDSFFDLGGHSLSATRLMFLVQERLGIDMPWTCVFGRPTIRLLAAHLEELRKNRAALPVLPPLVRVPRSGPPPLSLPQQRLWYLDKFEPGQAVYNTAFVIHIQGPLDVRSLESSLNGIVARHEVLRTTFSEEQGTPFQIIAPVAPFTLPVQNLGEFPAFQRGGEALRAIAAEAELPYDLAAGPLRRFTLYALEENRHILGAHFHHIVFDGLSLGVFLRELAARYDAVRNGGSAPGELPIQYADFACYQQQCLELGVWNEDLAYWRTQLPDGVPALDLPVDLPRAAAQRHDGGNLTRRLSRTLSHELRALSRNAQVTINTTLLTAWKVLLYRYTGQTDIAAGAAVAGRDRAGLDGLIGFFVNTVVLRSDLGGGPSFADLLVREHTAAMAAYAHGGLPFERMIAGIRPDRNASQPAMLQVMFAGQDSPIEGMECGGLSYSAEEYFNKTAKFELTLFFFDREDGLTLLLEYNTGLFLESTALRMLDHLETLLQAAAAHPEHSIDRLPLLAASESQRILHEWSGAPSPFPREQPLAALFEAQAAKAPDACAISMEGRATTYASLNASANRLAHYLVRNGVKPGDLVGVCMERSPGMVAAVLAILKAGGAYVPLDPDAPGKRIQTMVEDSAIRLVLTGQQWQACLSGCNVEMLDLQAENGDIDKESPENLPVNANGESLAYVLYTSGSTGVPKGVCIPQRAVARLVLNTGYCQLGPDSRVAHLSNVAFDAATFELWGPLLNGGRIVVIEKHVAIAPADLASALRKEGITALFVTAALFNRLIGVRPDIFASVETVMTGGEALDPHWIRAALNGGGAPARLLNGYGPTETTTFATWHLIDHVAGNARAIPIGRPIANTRVYVLDKCLQPVPVGVPGELYIGGDGVALGYLNRPALNAERFIENPFVPGGGRLYRTGDLVRWLPDGAIDFLGRLDNQIKLRGFRIELGEIETVLLRHGAVQEAAVLVREGDAEDRRLVAYVVAKEGATLTRQELIDSASERLPGYMVPRHIVMLDHLPLNRNGKLDRALLPNPLLTQPIMHHSREERTADTSLERAIAGTWARFLGVEDLKATDNFFELGGYSLMAIRVATVLSERLGCEVPLRELFEYRTPAQLAARIQILMANGGQADAPARDLSKRLQIRLVTLQKGRRKPFFCITGAGDVAGSYGPLVSHLDPDQPFHGFPDPQLDVTYDVFPTVEELAVHYIAAIKSVQPQGPYLLGGYSFGGMVSFEMSRQLIAAGEQVGLLVMIDTNAFPERLKVQRWSPQAWPILFNKVRVRMLMVYHTFPNILGYVRDIGRLLLSGGAPEVEGCSRPTAKEYLRWIWHDISNQYFMKQAGFVKPRFADARLSMIYQPWVRRVTNTMSSSIAAMQVYKMQPVDVRVTLMRVAHDPWRGARRDPTLGWGRFATRGVDVHVVDGNHMVLLQQPFVKSLARELQTCLDAAQADDGAGK